MSELTAGAHELERAQSCVRAHAHAQQLGAFAYDVLTTQAEGRSLFAGQKFMSQRASDHAVERDNANTDLGNLLSILERGPSVASEVALVAAFAVHGFGDAWQRAEPREREERTQKLVAHVDWLQAATAYRLMPAIDGLLQDAPRAAVYEAIAAAVAHDDTTQGEVDLSVRARNTARLCALANAKHEPARSLLARVRVNAHDAVTRATAAALLGETLPEPDREKLRVFGSVAAASRRPLVAVLRWVSGWALLHFGYRVLCFLLRVQREVEIELDGSALRIHGRTSLLGRTVRSSRSSYAVERVTGALRRARFALLRTIVGVLALCAGVLLGGHLAFEGSRGGGSVLLPLAALVTALGCFVDLAMHVLGDATHGRVELQLDVAGTRSIRLSGVGLAEADRLLERLAARLAQQRS